MHSITLIDNDTGEIVTGLDTKANTVTEANTEAIDAGYLVNESMTKIDALEPGCDEVFLVRITQ